MSREPVARVDLSAPALAEQYELSFRAYLAESDEEHLGRAYALGREAVAAQLSVLDLAESHHRAMRLVLEEAASPTERGRRVEAGAAFFREALSTFEIAARGYIEVQQVARLEHEHVMQLRALADASLAITATLSEQEILQLTVDAARTLIGGRRATATSSSRGLATEALSAVSPRSELDGEDGRGAALGVALGTAGRVLGNLTVYDAADRAFTPRDQALLTQLGQLASVALVNARLYGRESHIAHVLQRSLLPADLPAVAGLEAAARFRPAGEGIEVGGDFYDMFAARDGAVAAVIGDVQGKGPEAASITAIARHTLRAAAAYEQHPSRALSLLHRTLRQERKDGRFCTVALAHVRVVPGGARMTLACAGHPLPFAVRANGRVEPVGELGTMLGSDAEPVLTDVDVELADGDVVVLYTDGVTEVRRRRREVFGERELTRLLRTCAGLDPDEVAARIDGAVRDAAAGQACDDMAVLVLGPRCRPPSEASLDDAMRTTGPPDRPKEEDG